MNDAGRLQWHSPSIQSIFNGPSMLLLLLLTCASLVYCSVVAADYVDAVVQRQKENRHYCHKLLLETSVRKGFAAGRHLLMEAGRKKKKIETDAAGMLLLSVETWLQLGRLERPLPPPRQRLLMTLMGSKPAASLLVGMATSSVETVDSCFSADIHRVRRDESFSISSKLL